MRKRTDQVIYAHRISSAKKHAKEKALRKVGRLKQKKKRKEKWEGKRMDENEGPYIFEQVETLQKF